MENEMEIGIWDYRGLKGYGLGSGIRVWGLFRC